MASASNNKDIGSPSGYTYNLSVSFTENGQPDVVNNSTNITCSATIKSNGASWSSGYNSTLIVYWHDNRDNYDRQVGAINISSLGAGASRTVTGTINVVHNSDGNLSGYATATFTKNGTSPYTPYTAGVSTPTTALTTISRASQPSLVGGNRFNIGDTITINTNRKNTNFTHTVTFYFGNYSYQIATGVTDQVTFDTSIIANQMYQQIPNASVGQGNVTVVTYNGSTIIGTNNVIFEAYVVNSEPTGAVWYNDTNPTTIAITQSTAVIIRNNSTLQIKINNAIAKNYATLNNTVTAVINGVTYTGTLDNETQYGKSGAIEVGTLNLSSNTTATVTLKDSRGITRNYQLELYILDWQLPTAIISLQRENNYYSETNINVNAEYSSLDEKNTVTIKVREKKVSDTTWSSYTNLQDNVTTQLTLDNNFEWDVQVLVQDKLGSTTYNLTVERGIPIAFFDRSKRSVGINCFPADEESLEVSGENILTRIAGYGEETKQVTGDWNTACGEASGFYMGENLDNSPAGSTVANWWWVEHLVHDDLYQRQIAYSLLDNSEVYTRIMNNGTWNNWSMLNSITNGNNYIKIGNIGICYGQAHPTYANVNVMQASVTLPLSFTNGRAIATTVNYGNIGSELDAVAKVPSAVNGTGMTLALHSKSGAFTTGSNSFYINYLVIGVVS